MPTIGNVEVVWKHLPLEASAVREATALLAPPERNRATRFALQRHAARFILARAQLRRLLGVRLGVSPSAVELAYGECGKPALAPHLATSGLQFNVSRRDEFAAFAFTWGSAVGIDVEAIREVPDADAVAARYFSRNEHRTYQALAATAKLHGFFNCWTRKEAFVKARGDGMCSALADFDVSIDPVQPARILRVLTVPGERCGWRLESFVPTAGFTAAVVVRDSA